MQIAEIQRGLQQRGFRLDDAVPHDCPDCKERALARYALPGGRLGGRDISLCLACGKARSWRSSGGMTERREDTNFDVEQFLRG